MKRTLQDLRNGWLKGNDRCILRGVFRRWNILSVRVKRMTIRRLRHWWRSAWKWTEDNHSRRTPCQASFWRSNRMWGQQGSFRTSETLQGAVIHCRELGNQSLEHWRNHRPTENQKHLPEERSIKNSFSLWEGRTWRSPRLAFTFPKMAAVPPKKRIKIVSHCCGAPLAKRQIWKGRCCSRCGSLCSANWKPPTVVIK